MPIKTDTGERSDIPTAKQLDKLSIIGWSRWSFAYSARCGGPIQTILSSMVLAAEETLTQTKMEESMRYKLLLKTLALGLAMLVAMALSVAAQTTSGSLSGTVKDAHGAAISGARVQVTSTNRNETRTTQTGEDGRYEIGRASCRERV